MSIKSISTIFVIFLELEPIGCSAYQENIDTLCDIRHSFDSIKIDNPIWHNKSFGEILVVRNQEEWNNLSKSIKERVDDGCKDLLVSVTAKVLRYGAQPFKLEHINDSDVNIKIVAKNTLMIPEGQVFDRKSLSRGEYHWVMPCKKFGLNNLAFDDRNKNLSLLDDVFLIDSRIEEVTKYGEEEIQNRDGSLYKRIVKIWRFKTDLPNISENNCKDFYILLTRKWTSCRHRVLKVEDGYLYFYLRSEDAESLYQMCMDPNSDNKSYRTSPRCRFVNRPNREGVFICNDSIYVPMEIGGLTVSGNYQFFVVSDCCLNSLDVEGFRILGASGYSSIYVHNSRFTDCMWIRDNEFAYLSASAINIDNSENISVYKNSISQTRVNAIRCNGHRLSVWKNTLKNIGYMLQSSAISFSGTDIHIFENDIEDFYFSAIGMGCTASNDNSEPLTYIVERNKIHYSYSFRDSYLEHTLADGGGIYVGPQNTRGIIRYNYIEGVKGIGENRGIFLDDGGKNLAIYGNLVINTDNSYDIDLRYCRTYTKGIPDHNTYNYVFHNVITGYYRFEEGLTSSTCVVGDNVLVGKARKKNKINISRQRPDLLVSEGYVKNNKVFIPAKYKELIDSFELDPFIARRVHFFTSSKDDT